MEKATFGAGCFWGSEAAFLELGGVTETAVGYCGGHMNKPSYEDVCKGDTGHAEVVEVSFDPDKVSYEQLLDIFWRCHNPTQLNRQGPDIGHQYRSVIFYHNKNQQSAAEASKQALADSAKYNDPIVTEISPAQTFYLAEDYHQQYLKKRGLNSCHI